MIDFKKHLKTTPVHSAADQEEITIPVHGRPPVVVTVPKNSADLGSMSPYQKFQDELQQDWDGTRREIIFLLGPTCVGKSSVIDLALRTHEDVGAVMVGKMMRAKYPPEYFKGQGAPAHTQKEAQQMMFDGVMEEFKTKLRVIVDGQPRTVDHVQGCLDTAEINGARARFVILHAPVDLRKERASLTRQGPVLQLAFDRMNGDIIPIYEVLLELNRFLVQVEVVHNDGQLKFSEVVDRVLG